MLDKGRALKEVLMPLRLRLLIIVFLCSSFNPDLKKTELMRESIMAKPTTKPQIADYLAQKGGGNQKDGYSSSG